MDRVMDASFEDLRSWIRRVDGLGELRSIENAHWQLELGAIVDLIREQPFVPAVLFDSIADYPAGFRLLSNPFHSLNRVALTVGLPLGLSPRESSALWRERRKQIKPLPLRSVSDGPVLQNVREGDQVNLFKFPTPLWRELDGGRYIGTACSVISQDPDEGWLNIGTYRVMIVDERHVTVYMEPARHGRMHMQRCFELGKPFPVTIVIGQHPLFFLCSCTSFAGGKTRANEYEVAGGIRGEPIEVIRGEATGLPFPARAEIVIEAVTRAGETHPEGPFAEFTGYYASGTRHEPLFEVQRVYYRHDPIILGDAPPNPQRGTSRSFGFFVGGEVWDLIDAAGIPHVKAIASHAMGGAQFVVISIKQSYPGHAKQAAGILALSRGSASRYIVVVDDDIDAYDLGQVIWAIANRSDPGRDIDLIHDCTGSPLDPILNPTDKEEGRLFKTKAIINACKPWDWKEQFPPVNEMSAHLREKTMARWGPVIRTTRASNGPAQQAPIGLPAMP